MVCYLVKLVHKKTGLVQYKRGITKWLDPLKRFEDEKYDIFDISVLNLFVYSNESWLKLTTDFEVVFTGAVGTAEHLSEFSEHVGLQRSHGIANAKACLNSA